MSDQDRIGSTSPNLERETASSTTKDEFQASTSPNEAWEKVYKRANETRDKIEGTRPNKNISRNTWQALADFFEGEDPTLYTNNNPSKTPIRPGEFLLERVIKHMESSLGDTLPNCKVMVATKMGIGIGDLREVILGKRPVDANMAWRLERVGKTAKFWMGLQADWDLWFATENPDNE